MKEKPMKKTSICLGVLGAVSLQGCLSTSEAEKELDYYEQATEIAQDTIIVDGHIDVPYRLQEKWVDVSQATDGGDFDYPRAVAGGLNAPFMSIYVPASLDDSDESTKLAHQLIDYVERIVDESPDKFAIARSVEDVESQFDAGLISLPMGMENGSPLQGDMANLHAFYNRGVRYITLAHSQANHISDSSYDVRRKWRGLSPFGQLLVTEMNKVGMLIDISHVSDDAFYQVMELTRTPVIASHSSLRRFTPGFERNMDDEMLRALARNGGVIMINFGSGFVTREAQQYRLKYNQARKAFTAVNGNSDAALARFDSEYKSQHPYPYSTLEDVLNHIDYVVKLIGIDYVGIGSDYDGVGDSLPTGLKDVSTFPNLVEGLLKRGYDRREIEKILSGNFLRVWREVEAFSDASSA